MPFAVKESTSGGEMVEELSYVWGGGCGDDFD
jgi:hypothetical protein